MFFASDNSGPVPPQVLEAMTRANAGHVAGYGANDLSLFLRTSLDMSALYYAVTLTFLILVNALIAIMGDTYDRVSETRFESGLQQRAELADDTRATPLDQLAALAAAQPPLARPREGSGTELPS